MPKPRDYHLSEEELIVIETAIRHDKRPEVRQRCIAIRLLHLDHKPEQVAEMLQLSKNTVYDLISRGEIIAKKIGKVYRIPANSLAFIFTGLDLDLYNAQKADLAKIGKIQKEISRVRAKL